MTSDTLGSSGTGNRSRSPGDQDDKSLVTGDYVTPGPVVAGGPTFLRLPAPGAPGP